LWVSEQTGVNVRISRTAEDAASTGSTTSSECQQS